MGCQCSKPAAGPTEIVKPTTLLTAGKGSSPKAALIVVDVQNDFITGALANPYSAEEIVPTINQMRDAFEFAVISLDWHPEEHCSFVESANAGKVKLAGADEQKTTFAPFQTVQLAGDEDRSAHDQCLYPRHAVQGSEGAECHSDLIVKKDEDGFIYKGTKPNIDSYSAFFDNCQANDTGLTKMLRDRGITHIYCCGLVLDICVKATALHGAEAGFHTVVVEDACKPLSQDAVPAVKDELANAGVRVLTSAQAIEEVRRM